MRVSRLVALAVLASAVGIVPLTAAHASNRGGSDRSHEVRQNDTDDEVTEDNDSDGVPNNVADDGDNRHPSGKDRSVESGNSVNQGRSPSDPDGMTNGGADKPGGTGGIDEQDQDGNNGCGNDDDFEDDNNGRCLGRTEQAVAVDVLSGGVLARDSGVEAAFLALGAAPREETAPTVAGEAAVGIDSADAQPAKVLASSTTRPGGGSGADFLPVTGLPLVALALAALTLIGLGIVGIGISRYRGLA